MHALEVGLARLSGLTVGHRILLLSMHGLTLPLVLRLLLHGLIFLNVVTRRHLLLDHLGLLAVHGLVAIHCGIGLPLHLVLRHHLRMHLAVSALHLLHVHHVHHVLLLCLAFRLVVEVGHFD